jgi:hypothetical protein
MFGVRYEMCWGWGGSWKEHVRVHSLQVWGDIELEELD